jgi:hypothetical protein
MRDWQTGPQWDRRTLYELGADYLIHVTCGFCRHQTRLRPRQILTVQPWHHWWGAIAHRLRCDQCGQKKATIRLVDAQDQAEQSGPKKPRSPTSGRNSRCCRGNVRNARQIDRQYVRADFRCLVQGGSGVPHWLLIHS